MAKVVVHKFGGTSVLREAATMFKIILASLSAGELPVVVVSALAGVTNLLEQVFVDRHDQKLVEEHFVKIDELHRAWLQDLGLSDTLLDEHLASLRDKFVAACKEARSFQQQRDAILALGEPLSAKGFAAYFNEGVAFLSSTRASAIAVDTSESNSGMEALALRVNNRFGNASPLSGEANANLLSGLHAILDAHDVPIVTGFIGRAGFGASASVATVGRGGSDLSACCLGALLGACEVRIWSDVPGMLSADPRVVDKEHVRPIPRLPFRHAMEMAGGGGKLHPRALVYAAKAGVPVRMLSTFEVGAPGTLITNDCTLQPGLVGVVQLKNVTIITIFDPAMSEAEGFVANVTRVLARHGIVIGLIATGEVEVTMTVTDPSRRLEEALDEIRSEMDVEPEVIRDISLITVVHTAIDAAIEERIAACLRRSGVEALAISRGFSRIAFQIPVPTDEANLVVQIIHEELLKA